MTSLPLKDRVPGPQLPDMARTLIGRAEHARPAWNTPAITRNLAASPAPTRETGQTLRAILAEYGWPGRTLVGDEGAQAAAALALHCDHDPDLQRSLLKALREAVERGEATAAQWAHLYDRCRAAAGRPQVYGTQYAFVPDVSGGRLDLYPVEFPGRLDELRAQVGLGPQAEQEGRLRRHHITAAPSMAASVAATGGGRAA